MHPEWKTKCLFSVPIQFHTARERGMNGLVSLEASRLSRRKV